MAAGLPCEVRIPLIQRDGRRRAAGPEPRDRPFAPRGMGEGARTGKETAVIKNPNLSTEHQKAGDASRPKDTLDRDTPPAAPARSTSDPAKDRSPKG